MQIKNWQLKRVKNFVYFYILQKADKVIPILFSLKRKKHAMRFLALFVFTLFPSITFADIYNGSVDLSNKTLDNTVINGRATLKEVSASSLSVNGSLKFDHVKIDHSLTVSGSAKGHYLEGDNFSVNGSLKGDYIKFNNATINGSVSGDHISISDKLKVFGRVKVSDSQFSSVEISSEKSIFKNSKIEQLSVLKDDDVKQEIYLEEGTIVSGNIEFESGKGVVYLKDNSRVEGKVSGGKVIQK